MKEVRLNDKMWFGKYKDSRIADIIKSDPDFIQKLVKENKIKLDEKCQFLFDSKHGHVEKKFYTIPGDRVSVGVGVGAWVNGRQYTITENGPRVTRVTDENRNRIILKTKFSSSQTTSQRFSIIKKEIDTILIKRGWSNKIITESLYNRLFTKIENQPVEINDEYVTTFNSRDILTGVRSDTLIIDIFNDGRLMSHNDLL